MNSVLLLGDLHLGKGLSYGKAGIGSNLNSRLVDQLTILDWVLDQALDRKVSRIVLTGDVFDDPKPHPIIISLFISWLKKCVSNNIIVHIIVGNHDILRAGAFTMSALDIVVASEIDNVFIHNDVGTIHMHDMAFTVLPFRDRKSYNTNSNSEAIRLLKSKLPYEISSIDRSSIKIVIGHLAIEGSIYVGDEIDDMSNELFCPINMFNGYDYVWMGHIHKPQVLSKSPYISHIGSMDLSDFGETNHTKIIAIIDPEASQFFEYINIPTRPLKQISITVPINITNTTDYVITKLANENFNKAILKLNIFLENKDAINIDRQILEDHIYKLNAFHIYRINEERKISLIKKDNENYIDNTVNEITAIKMFAFSNIENEIRSEFISIATAIVEEANAL
jgi:exonuclease SbcD